jgi:hypothetical protein
MGFGFATRTAVPLYTLPVADHLLWISSRALFRWQRGSMQIRQPFWVRRLKRIITDFGTTSTIKSSAVRISRSRGFLPLRWGQICREPYL